MNKKSLCLFTCAIVLSGCFLRRHPDQDSTVLLDDAALEAVAEEPATEVVPVSMPLADNGAALPKLAKPKLWNIQVTAETDPTAAQDKVDKLAENGVEAVVQESVVKGTLYYRVLVGPYRSKDSAREDLERITNFDVNQGTPFLTTARE